MKNYKKIEPKDCHLINGTSFAGVILKTDVNKLFEKLGAPTDVGSGDNKVSICWGFQRQGSVITIYDYKEDKHLTKIRDWHIGGKGDLSSALVEFLKGKGFSDDEIIMGR